MKGKKSRFIRIGLDLLAALLFVTLYSMRVPGGLTYHEVAGLTAAAAVVLHLLLNRKWLSGVSRRLFSKELPVKTRIAYGVDLLLAAAIGATIVTGVMISKVIFPHTSEAFVGAESLHKFAAYLALLLMGVHIGLSWNKVKALLKRKPGKRKRLRAAGILAALLLLATGVWQIADRGYFQKLSEFTSGYSETEEHGSVSGHGNGSGKGKGLGGGEHGGYGAGSGGEGTISDLSVSALEYLSITGAFAVAAYAVDQMAKGGGKRRPAIKRI